MGDMIKELRYPFIPSYGRRRSHGLSEAQRSDIIQLSECYCFSLPDSQVSPLDLFSSFSQSASYLSNSFKKVYVEIGFGSGEHLVQNAAQNCEIAFIGCEPFENGIVKALRDIHTNALKNVRIFKGDARLLLEKFPSESIDRFYILFPDPWPKRRYNKRRLISETFVQNLLYPKLRKQGKVIVATDCEDYMQNIVDILGNSKYSSHFKMATEDLKELQKRPEWFTPTRYEQKAISRGLHPFYLVAKKL